MHRNPGRLPLNKDTTEKMDTVRRLISQCQGAVVAFSGGVDSAFLLSVAKDILGDRLLAVTVQSAVVPPSEVAGSRELARLLEVEHEVIEADVMGIKAMRENHTDRCYHCKMHVFSMIMDLARERGLPCVLEASNLDDAGDYRPGVSANKELGVISPLAVAGLTKGEIRRLSKERGLPTWDKPAMACLATRIPYDAPVTVEKLEQVRKGEEYLAGIGFGACRLRHHGSLARIEVPPGDIERVTESELRLKIVEQIKSLGFKYVSVDMEGYRTGSMNEVLDI
jgi:uncharacterized protein